MKNRSGRFSRADLDCKFGLITNKAQNIFVREQASQLHQSMPKRPRKAAAANRPRVAVKNVMPDRARRTYNSCRFPWLAIFRDLEQKLDNDAGDRKTVAKAWNIGYEALCKRYSRWVKEGRDPQGSATKDSRGRKPIFGPVLQETHGDLFRTELSQSRHTIER